MFYTHGGGWIKGGKENIVRGLQKDTFLKFVEEGYAVVSINYRLVRGRTLVMKDCVVDAMDALRYLSKNSKDLFLDTNKVFVIGDSAGGQLAQMVTLADAKKFKGDKSLFEYKYNVIAGISWYGPSDFTKVELFKTEDTTKNPDRFGGRIVNRKKIDASTKLEMYKEMSPISYLTPNSPPLYMMAAENDTTIPVAHAYHMKKYADSIKANVELFTVKNAGHNWRRAGGAINPSSQVFVQKTVDFFNKYKK